MQLLSKYNILNKEIRNDCLLSALMYNNRRLLEQMLICLDFQKNELNSLLESVPGIHEGFIKVSLLKQIPSFKRYDHDIFIAHIVQSIIEQGNANTFIRDAKIIVPQLQEMLNKYSKYNLRHREAVEILINESVDIDTEKVIEHDRKFSLDLRIGRLY